MNHFLQVCRSWWFTTMVPAPISLTTIDEREVWRKRRLFSTILLFSFIILFIFTLQELFVGTSVNLEMVNFASCSEVLFVFWLNRLGYLKIASTLHFAFAFAAAVIQINTAIITMPSFVLVFWAVPLAFPVAAGLFLPFWGPLLLGVSEVVYMVWFVFYAHPQLIAFFIHSPLQRLEFLVFTCLMIVGMTTFSAIYAITTRNAVIQADRAVEVEEANKKISYAYQELEAAHEMIQMQALTDGLTELPNHRAIMNHLHKELSHARRHHRPFSILFFDADRFKSVNDAYGHAVGDEVLRQIGKRAGRILRAGDVIGRFGGEEFVVLLPETDLDEARIVAEHMRATIAAEPITTAEIDNNFSITVSIGIASYPVDGDTEEVLLQEADAAMYMAKHSGRNQVRIAEEAREQRGLQTLHAV